MMYELEWYRVSIALRLYRRDVGHFLIYPKIRLIAIYIRKSKHILFKEREVIYYDGFNQV